MLGWRAPSPDVILGRSRIHSVEQQLALLGWSGVPWPRARPTLSLTVCAEAMARIRERLAASGPRAPPAAFSRPPPPPPGGPGEGPPALSPPPPTTPTPTAPL